ncbi:MAG: SPOR domain-containing protein [Polaromonas sp.]
MLRALVLALALANGLYFVWGQGLLAAYGFAPARQAEPERLAQQIRPEALRLLASGPAAPRPADVVARPAPLAGESCLQVGVFTEQQVNALRPRLQASLPAGSWSFESSGESSRWIIYMGKYVSRQAMNRKRQMLDQLGISHEPPASPRLNPGLSLGSFNSKAEAEQALEPMAQRGLRSAKVVPEHPELPSQWLKLPQANAAIRAKVEALKPLLADKALQTCS